MTKVAIALGMAAIVGFVWGYVVGRTVEEHKARKNAAQSRRES